MHASTAKRAQNRVRGNKSTELKVVDGDAYASTIMPGDPATRLGDVGIAPPGRGNAFRRYWKFYRTNYYWLTLADRDYLTDLCSILVEREELSKKLRHAFMENDPKLVCDYVRAKESTSAHFMKLVDRLGGNPSARASAGFLERNPQLAAKNSKDFMEKILK